MGQCDGPNKQRCVCAGQGGLPSGVDSVPGSMPGLFPKGTDMHAIPVLVPALTAPRTAEETRGLLLFCGRQERYADVNISC